jgi:hypothetical protein
MEVPEDIHTLMNGLQAVIMTLHIGIQYNIITLGD